MGKNNTTKPFIQTSDKDTAEELIKLGFQIIQVNSSGWTFHNSAPTHFNLSEAVDKTKYVQTDKLYM